MKRSKLRSKSPKTISKLRRECDALVFKHLKLIRGEKCEFCGRTQGLTPFHILPRGHYPRLQFAPSNILIACWLPCHYKWHHDPWKADEMKEKIKQLRGENYKEDLMVEERLHKKMDRFALEQLRSDLQKALELGKA